MTPLTWVETGLLAWAASLVFASFGLFMGYLLPTENVMQVIGPLLAVFALFGGLLVPLALLPSVMQDIAPWMPTYGVASIARFPLVGGGFDPIWLLSVILWTLAFAAAAVLLFRTGHAASLTALRSDPDQQPEHGGSSDEMVDGVARGGGDPAPARGCSRVP